MSGWSSTLPDWVCTREEPHRSHEIHIGERPFHLTMEVETAIGPEGLAQVLGLVGTSRFGLHATTRNLRVKLENKDGTETHGVPYRWGYVYDVSAAWAPQGIALDWGDEDLFIERVGNNPPVTHLHLGLRPKEDGSFIPGWGPPYGWHFRNLSLQVFDEAEKWEWTRQQHLRMITALTNAEKNLDVALAALSVMEMENDATRSVQLGRNKVHHVLGRMTEAVE